MKVTKIDSRTYNVQFTEEELHRYEFEFNGYIYRLCSVLNEYSDELCVAQRQEVLPGVYITDCCNYSKHWEFNSIKNYVYKAVRSIFGYSFQFTIDNKRNEYNFPNIKSFQKKETKESAPLCGAGTSYVNICPELISYPESMGSGAWRCCVWAIFQELDLFNTFNYNYNMFSLAEILENISANGRLLEYCQESDPCKGLLDKFKTGKYVTGTGVEEIRISYSDGKYQVDNGCHRVCVAKRFGITEIPVELYVDLSKKNKTDDSGRYAYRHTFRPPACKKVMEDYDKILMRISFSRDDGQELLSTPIEEIDLVGYLEQKKGRSIEEILKELN